VPAEQPSSPGTAAEQPSDQTEPATQPAVTDASSAQPADTLAERLAARIRTHGPIPAGEFVEAALYDPDDGFYAARGSPGTSRGDFVTAPELGPLFGAVLARALPAWRSADDEDSGLSNRDAVRDETAEFGTGEASAKPSGEDRVAGSNGRDMTNKNGATAGESRGCAAARECHDAALQSGCGTGEGRDDAAVPQFCVVEVGAGTGALARAVLAAFEDGTRPLGAGGMPSAAGIQAGNSEPLTRDAAESAAAATAADRLRWWAVEPSPRLRGMHPHDPRVRSVASVDEVEGSPDVVLANELLDNLPFGIIERRYDGWHEVLVSLDDAGRFAETPGPKTRPPTADLSIQAQAAADAAPPGARIPVHDVAVALLRDLRRRFPQARIVVFDYAATTAELLERSPGWLRCYAGQARHDDWLSDPGSRDITCDLAIEQIATALDNPPAVTSQADWLRAAGIDDLVDEGRDVWEQRAGVGDLAAMQARSRVREAEALTDPAGLGGFTVFDWQAPAVVPAAPRNPRRASPAGPDNLHGEF